MVVVLFVFVMARSLLVEQNGMLVMAALVVPVAPRVVPLAGNSASEGAWVEPWRPPLTWVVIEPPEKAMNPPPPPPPGPSDSGVKGAGGGDWLPPLPPLAWALRPLRVLAETTIVPPAPPPPIPSRFSLRVLPPLAPLERRLPAPLTLSAMM